MNSDKTISKFMNDVIRARAEAFRQNIKANAVLINKNLVKISELYHISPLGVSVIPPMICGLGVYDAGELLPEDYAFAVTHIEEVKNIVKERDEYKHRAEVAEKALQYAVSKYRCDECPCLDCNAEIRGSQECIDLIVKTYKESAEMELKKEKDND